MTNNQKIVVRFPPSPTGFLHMGNVRTALYNYLFAKKNNGQFIVRVEDTDRQRSKKEYELDMFESLTWLGLVWDNKGNEWHQTERLPVYKKYLDLLIKAGAAYISEETEGENREVVRFKNPGGKIKFKDLIRNEVEIDVGDLGDFIIARNINEPLYHLAVVIDDLEAGVTHIVRGEDHISNTPRQILIWQAIAAVSKTDLNLPQYAHLPMILATDKSKLSKRKHGEIVSLKYYREKGYEPEAILNFLALVGWNPGDSRELFSLTELIETFDLAKVQKKAGIFNVEKLDWLNREYLLHSTTNTQKTQISAALLQTKFKNHQLVSDLDFMEKFRKICLDRIHRWGEIPEIIEAGEWDYFFEAPNLDKSKIAWKNQDLTNTKQSLIKVLAIIESNTEKENIKKEILSLAEKEGKGEILWPLRYSLSGKEKSPDPFTLIDILDQTSIKNRVSYAITLL